MSNETQMVIANNNVDGKGGGGGTVPASQRVVSGTFECAATLTDKRTLRVTGYFFNDDKLHDMHQRVDMAQDVLDRQAIRADLVNKEGQIAGQLANLDNIRESFEGLVELTKKGHKLTSQQKMQLDNFEPTKRQANKIIDGLRAAIAEGRQKINGAAHA